MDARGSLGGLGRNATSPYREEVPTDAYEPLDSGRVFERLAQLYGLPDVVRGEQGPTRMSGYPGHYEVESSNGRRIVVSQENNIGFPVDSYYQRNVFFQQRCYSLGLPCPKPVFTPDGNHGSLVIDDTLYPYAIFLASEWVEGEALHTADVSSEEKRRFLAEAGRAGALLRVASIGVGSWDLYPRATASSWKEEAQQANKRGYVWAQALAHSAQTLGAAAGRLPLAYYDLERSFIEPNDMHPDDVMIRPDRSIAFVDWNHHMHPAQKNFVLGYSTSSWFDWAAEGKGLSSDEAQSIMQASFAREMKRHKLPLHPEPQPAHTELNTAITELLEDIRIANSDTGYLPQMMVNSLKRLPERLERALECARPVLQHGRKPPLTAGL